MSDRIQKVLAKAGYASRREIEAWIKQGHIKVNGQLATIGQQIDPEQDYIKIKDKTVPKEKLFQHLPTKVLLYNKPIGVICSRKDEENRNTIFDYIPSPAQGRWVSVGRLDINSSGLLLLTNNGELANRLMHPRYQVKREYAVRLLGQVTDEHKQQLLDGVELDDDHAAFASIHQTIKKGANQWFTVSLFEGKKREVRRLWEAVGCKVNRLIRIGYGPIKLPKDLRSNRNQLLTFRETQQLLASVGL